MDIKIIAIGNGIALIGSILLTLIGFVKDSKKVVILQIVQLFVMGISTAVLGGIAGTVTNILGIARNAVCLKGKLSMPVKFVFIVLNVVISFTFMLTVGNGFKAIELLPILACCVYTYFLGVGNDKQLKLLNATTPLPWIVYDLYLFNYVAAIFDGLSVLTNTIGLYRVFRGQNKQNQKQIKAHH